MTKEELVVELRALAKRFADRECYTQHEYYDLGYIQAYEGAADELNELLDRAEAGNIR